MNIRRIVGVTLLATGLTFTGAGAFATGHSPKPSTSHHEEADGCDHGATGKACRPDPQPSHGKDCVKHGNHGGINEDHCAGGGPSPTTTKTPHPTKTEHPKPTKTPHPPRTTPCPSTTTASSPPSSSSSTTSSAGVTPTTKKTTHPGSTPSSKTSKAEVRAAEGRAEARLNSQIDALHTRIFGT